MKKNILYNLYERMLLIRLVEEKIANNYDQKKMRCPTHLSVGQEAVSAAFGLAVDKKDFAISTHRSHAHYLAKGGSLDAMIAEIYGKSTGCSKGKGGSMHLIDTNVNFMGSSAIVGNSIPVGVGLGLSIKLKKTNQISCVFFGDGATEEGVFFESINFAALKELPVLFICENNFYSVYSPLSVRQPKERNISKVVESMGIESFSVNGYDVKKTYNTFIKLFKKIRKNKRPLFIELETYRWREHCGPNYDNDIGYRSETEFQKWLKKDPILLIEKEIKLGDTNGDKKINIIKNLINAKITQAFIKAEKADPPNLSEVYKDIYAKT